jgi:triosephosphate isomerase
MFALVGSAAYAPATTAPAIMSARVRAPEMMARTPLMAGNWKMNTVLEEAKSLAKEVADAAKGAEGVDVAVCVPFPFLVPVGDVLSGTGVGLGAQDCYYEASGAYTAAVSTSMLKSVGSAYVLAGHSERRATFGDSDADINKKTLKILEEGLKCILCIGTRHARSKTPSRALCKLRAPWVGTRHARSLASDSNRRCERR